ncbi:ABC transporter substrate-binding protein [Deinococcus aerophilus]|uniref:Leucine-binding protein domain-containing protein n=1 Tax=Deinococcus aerophilus TaxID=522488 RepID=A0ABQ2GZH9_9DEIO|nr:ABC transporter substrate-binding protein [Deinococcus aerophilus]GGM19982.1 hypothetical protein GCM10010841_30040 [Deinococcus aerophilus]
MKPDLNRRTVLKSLALAAATCSPGLAAQAVRAAPARPAPRVGVLPARSVYPGLGQRYLAGLTLSLGAPGVAQTEVVVRHVGPQAAALEAAARELLAEGVHLLISLGDGSAAALAALAERHHVPLLVSELGSLMPRGETGSPFVFCNSLQLWQSEWALGHWTARHLGNRVQVVTTLLESGYDLPYAFASGVADGGGTVVATSFADNFGGGHETDPVLASVRALGPEHVHLIASGPQPAAFIAAYQRHFLLPRPALSLSGLAVSGPRPAAAGAAGRHSALSWASGLDLPLNRLFTSSYRRLHSQAPDAVAALGYETGRWLLQALDAVGGQVTQTQAWLQAFAHARFDSPRGTVWADPQTRRVQAPIYLRRSAVKGRAVSQQVVQVLSAPPLQHRALQALLDMPRSGWSMPYLQG